MINLVLLGLLAVSLLFAWIAPTLTRKWDSYSDRQTRKHQLGLRRNPRSTRRANTFKGGSYYPAGIQPPRHFNILGRYLFGSSAALEFASNGFRFRMPGYTISRRYSDIVSVQMSRFSYLEFKLSDNSRFYLRSSMSQSILNRLGRHSISTEHIKTWRIVVSSLLIGLPFIIPFSILMFMIQSDRHNTFMTVLWTAYPVWLWFMLTTKKV